MISKAERRMERQVALSPGWLMTFSRAVFQFMLINSSEIAWNILDFLELICYTCGPKWDEKKESG
jgi:hypothetical protein